MDPATGEIIEYPLPKTISESWQASVVGPGPWELRFDRSGDLFFNEFYDCTISLFDTDRAADPLCQSLAEDGSNPCMTDWVMPDRDPSLHRMHSIEFDNDGCLWFTEHAPDGSDIDAALGFLTADRNEIVRLPPLDLYGEEVLAAGAGVGVDRETGDIWFGEFWRKRITRLWEIHEGTWLSIAGNP